MHSAIMAKRIHSGSWVLIAAVCCGVGAPAFAQSLAAGEDPPDRAAVVNALDGNASLQPAGSEEWTPDLLNRPLTTGDKLWIDADSRGEMHLGATAIRIGERTALELLNVDDNVAQFRLTSGVLSIHLRYLSADEVFEVDTPNAAVTLVEPGVYRIDVNEAGDVTQVGVLAGQAQVASAAEPLTLDPQQHAEISGLDAPAVNVDYLPPPDGFDEWAAQRDRREDESASAEYVSRDMTGYEDLDEYGTWEVLSVYGPVWVPRVAAWWAPYHDGHWVWIAPWGWTWVDEDRWGYAPFHYGRWLHVRGRWCWSPGRIRPTTGVRARAGRMDRGPYFGGTRRARRGRRNRLVPPRVQRVLPPALPRERSVFARHERDEYPHRPFGGKPGIGRRASTPLYQPRGRRRHRGHATQRIRIRRTGAPKHAARRSTRACVGACGNGHHGHQADDAQYRAHAARRCAYGEADARCICATRRRADTAATAGAGAPVAADVRADAGDADAA